MIRKVFFIFLFVLSVIFIITGIVNQTNHYDIEPNHYDIEQNMQSSDKPGQNNEIKAESENSTESAVQKYNQSPVPILMYHSINDVPLGLEQLSIRNRDFEKQIKYLSDNGYTPLFFDELKNSGMNKKPIIITFDDGYSDNYYKAYPILKKYKCKATIFIIVKSLNSPKFLAKNQIMEMADFVSFQSHTLSHMELDKISEAGLESELSLSKKVLNEITKRPVNVLSYPCGKYNGRVADIASKYYDYAVTTKQGYYNKADGNYRISRIRVSRSDTLNEFISKMQ
jgi:peptidoglycan/xylan/chitin deacetylase (PgdA/CDA1 family)